MKEKSNKYGATHARRWRLKHPEACSVDGCHRPKIINRSLCAHHKEIVYDHNMRKKAQRKVEVLTHYGPEHKLQCCWKECTVADIDMLSLDHVNNDGAEDRRNSAGGSGDALYRKVEREGFPTGFQTLCFNHQMKKERLLRRCYKAQRTGIKHGN